MRNLLLVAVIAGCASPAHAVEFRLTASVNNFNQNVYSYTLGSGIVTQLSSVFIDQAVVLDIESTGSASYAAVIAPNHAPPNRFYSVNTVTGLMTDIGPLGFNGIEGDLAWNSAAGIMYGVSGGPAGTGFGRLFRVNLATGLATNFVTFDSFTDCSGMTFDNTGHCWVIASNLNGPAASRLIEVNPDSGAVLSDRALPVNLRVTLGLVTDPATGTIYTLAGDGRVYSVNTGTAGLTLLDTIAPPAPGTGRNFTGISLIPAPGGLAICLTGLLALSRRRR